MAPRKRKAAVAEPATEQANKLCSVCKAMDDSAAEFCCPITQELPIDPVTAEDGRVYERSAIEETFTQDVLEEVQEAEENLQEQEAKEAEAADVSADPEITGVRRGLEAAALVAGLLTCWRRFGTKRTPSRRPRSRRRSGSGSNLRTSYMLMSVVCASWRSACVTA